MEQVHYVTFSVRIGEDYTSRWRQVTERVNESLNPTDSIKTWFFQEQNKWVFGPVYTLDAFWSIETQMDDANTGVNEV